MSRPARRCPTLVLPLLLKINMGAGHGGRSGRYEALRDEAFRYAFVLDVIGDGGGAVAERRAATP